MQASTPRSNVAVQSSNSAEPSRLDAPPSIDAIGSLGFFRFENKERISAKEDHKKDPSLSAFDSSLKFPKDLEGSRRERKSFQKAKKKARDERRASIEDSGTGVKNTTDKECPTTTAKPKRKKKRKKKGKKEKVKRERIVDAVFADVEDKEAAEDVEIVNKSVDLVKVNETVEVDVGKANENVEQENGEIKDIKEASGNASSHVDTVWIYQAEGASCVAALKMATSNSKLPPRRTPKLDFLGIKADFKEAHAAAACTVKDNDEENLSLSLSTPMILLGSTSCPHCTLLNPPSASVCSACGLPLTPNPTLESDEELAKRFAQYESLKRDRDLALRLVKTDGDVAAFDEFSQNLSVKAFNGTHKLKKLLLPLRLPEDVAAMTNFRSVALEWLHIVEQFFERRMTMGRNGHPNQICTGFLVQDIDNDSQPGDTYSTRAARVWRRFSTLTGGKDLGILVGSNPYSLDPLRKTGILCMFLKGNCKQEYSEGVDSIVFQTEKRMLLRSSDQCVPLIWFPITKQYVLFGHEDILRVQADLQTKLDTDFNNGTKTVLEKVDPMHFPAEPRFPEPVDAKDSPNDLSSKPAKQTAYQSELDFFQSLVQDGTLEEVCGLKTQASVAMATSKTRQKETKSIVETNSYEIECETLMPSLVLDDDNDDDDNDDMVGVLRRPLGGTSVAMAASKDKGKAVRSDLTVQENLNGNNTERASNEPELESAVVDESPDAVHRSSEGGGESIAMTTTTTKDTPKETEPRKEEKPNTDMESGKNKMRARGFFRGANAFFGSLRAESEISSARASALAAAKLRLQKK